MSVRPGLRWHWPLALFLCFLISLGFVCSSESADQREILLKLKSALEESETDVFRTWSQENSPCNFTGIVCDLDEMVKEINLPRQKLVGVLPFDSICSLQSLEKIDLSENFLHGSIAEDLKNCRRLQYLDLCGNKFSGEVPDLSALSELKLLSLNNSGFSGLFPWKSLQNLTELGFLSLGDNLFDESPFPVDVLKLEKLYWLFLTNCSITGQIPEGIQNLTLLENLELSANRLTGEIPAGITKLNKLRQLELYGNGLTGKLPVGFGNLTSLGFFDASQNKLEGDLSELRFLKEISSLQLFENQFTGEVPEEFGELKKLTALSLYRNKLIGQLPQKLGSWAAFNYVDVSENFFTGPIPPDMCKNGQMTDLLILDNNFTGKIPDTYASCKSLVRLRVNKNLLSGAVPAGIWGLPNLFIIDLSMNQLEGPLTNDIANAKSLAMLFLAKNRFSGELPSMISQTSSLVSIQMSSNQFSGEIPASIGELKKLNSLYLDENKFSGMIPPTIGSCASLIDVNLAGNSLSGKIPASLGSLPSLNSLNLSRNKLSGEIPATLSWPRLSLLDLSNNQLVGQVPQSLSIGSFEGNSGLCSSSIKSFQSCPPGSHTSRHLKTLISCFIAGLLVLLISLACYLFMKLKRNSLDHPLKQSSWDMKPYRVLSFTEKDIIDAVKSENLIGKGGSGNVYKVELNNGTTLAVKHIWTGEPINGRNCQSSAAMLKKNNLRSTEYQSEVAALSAVRHVNVVKLFCSITSEDSNLLVYEYLPNGSLWDRLHTCHKINMGWEVRYEIAVGAARGLEYLHHGYDRPVIHRDVKSSNILLDEEWKPRIADFGLAKIVQPNGAGDWTQVIAGTHGYMAPEYAYMSKITEKSDVYSFGVVLMELVTGRRPVEPEFGDKIDIVRWVYSKKQSKESLLDIVDSSISETLKDDAIDVLRIAVLCTARVPALRPSMRMVVQLLEEAKPRKLTSFVVDSPSQNSPNGDPKKQESRSSF